jgi:uncharacterized protein DUF1579
MRQLCACLVVLFVAAVSLAQEQPPQPKPGPEHARLKSMEGTWDAKMIMPGAEKPVPCVATYKMELGGLWLVSDFRCDDPAMKFQGKGLDSYDPAKKKYVGVWVDSMMTAPMTVEGTYDEKTKTTTSIGEGPGPDGKPMKMKMVTKETDANHQTFQMFAPGPDGKEALSFTIEYTRRK